MFEQCTREKVRFNSPKGQVTVEDLWDLPLTSLDVIAKDLFKSIQEDSTPSFIGKVKPSVKPLKMRLNVVKRVIEYKLDEIDARESAAENKIQRDKILDIINEKEDDALKGKDVKTLRKMLKEFK